MCIYLDDNFAHISLVYFSLTNHLSTTAQLQIGKRFPKRKFRLVDSGFPDDFCFEDASRTHVRNIQHQSGHVYCGQLVSKGSPFVNVDHCSVHVIVYMTNKVNDYVYLHHCCVLYWLVTENLELRRGNCSKIELKQLVFLSNNYCQFWSTVCASSVWPGMILLPYSISFSSPSIGPKCIYTIEGFGN